MINPFKLFNIFMMLLKDKREAVKEVHMDGQVKPGWKTTEFWLTLVPQIPVIVGLFLGVNNPIVIALAAASSIAYTLGRNWTKGNAIKVATDALTAAAESAKSLP